MKKYFAIAAFAFAALVSCQKEIAKEEVIPAPVPDDYVGYTLYASLGEQTKSTLDGKSVVWAVGDKVAVYADGAGDALEFEVASVASGSVAFYGNAPESATSFVAVYPFESALGISDGVVKVNIPSEQYIPAGGDIDPTAMPSAAVFETIASKPTFYNLMSLAKFNVGDNEYVDEVRISSEGEIRLAGPIEAKVFPNDAPEVSNLCDEDIVIKCEEPLLPNKDYYAVVAPAEGVEGFNAGGVSGSRQSLRTAAEAVTFKRNGGLNLGDITKDASWLYRYISNGDDLKNFLEGAADYPEGWKVEMLEDIFLNNIEITPAKAWAGEFDGGGYSIKSWTSNGDALFLENRGTVGNFTIDSSCSLNVPETLPAVAAFVVANNYGTVSGITNNADISGTTTFSGGRVAAIVGLCDASGLGKGIIVEDCVNNGNITLNTEANTAGTQYVGTIVGSMGNSEDNVLRNCTNNGNLSVICSGSNTKNFYIGGVAGGTTNGSQNINLVNNGDVLFSCGSHEAALCLAGISSYTTGCVTDCVNTGSITYHSDLSLKATFVAGIAGYFARNTMSGCTNKGAVTIDAGRINGRNSIGDMNSTIYNGDNAITAGLSIGGLVSATGQMPVFENCDNYGDVTCTLSQASANDGTHTAARPSMGGLVGDCAGPMTNCNNYGNVAVTIGNGTAFQAKNAGYTLYVGGIVGSSYNFCGATKSGGSDKNSKNKFTLENCNNSGNVAVVSYNTHTTNHAIGGICGWPQSEDQTAVYVAKNCSNSGDISFSGKARARVGGIHGGTGRMDGCTNTGYISNDSAQKESVAGSIAGFHSQAHTFSNCVAKGTVEAKSAVTGLGGLVGNLGNVAFKGMDGCSVDCELIGGPENATGLIVGKYNGTTKEIVLGTEDDPIEIAGKIDGTAVTEENVGTYVCGSNGMDPKVHSVYYSLGGKNYYAVAFAEDLEKGQFIYASKKYPIVQLADGRWWMAAPLAYVPDGYTVSGDPAEDSGIWYTYTVDNKVATASTDNNDGYLYDYPTAMGKKADEITFGTQAEWETGNYRDFEGAQGICPPGWYIPTRADFLKLVGNSNKDDTRGETAAVNDPTALYYVTACSGSSVKVFNEAGWNWSFLGARNKTSNTQTGAYNVTVTDATKCSVDAWIGKPALNQVMSSTAYKPNATGTSFQYFCLMSTFTSAYMDGRLSLSYAQYLQGVEVRCIRNQES